MQQSLQVLKMGRDDLVEFIRSEAERNPFLKLTYTRVASASFDAASLARSAEPGLMEIIHRQIAQKFKDNLSADFAYRVSEFISSTGWLERDIADIAGEHGIDLEKAEDILAELQEFEPSGIFARTLSECLAIQARHEGHLTPEMRRMIENLPLIAKGRLGDLSRLISVPETALRDMLRRIRGYDPKPGLRFGFAEPSASPPELSVRKVAGTWEVSHNRGNLPIISVLVPETEMNPAIRDLVSRARMLETSVRRRQATLLKIGATAVARQHMFLERGAIALVPLSMSVIADDLGLHVSTVSRAVADCLIETPTGTIPISRLFSRAVVFKNAGIVSTASLTQLVAQIIREEDPRNPVSDGEIQAMMATMGFAVTRRSVANYRKALNILTADRRRIEK